MFLSTALVPFIALLGVQAKEEPSAAFCCNALAANGLADALLYPENDVFTQHVNSYYSEQARFSPTCILRPRNAAEVSLAVKTLVEANKTQLCQFAVRGNGHTTAPLHANIENGVTIDLKLMNSTQYNNNNNTASIQPGATWGSVYSTLDPLQVMVAGGRSFSVGVSGLVIGGGNSFFSPRIGMVCDGVEQFEVVLANGDIVNANRQENSDLFQVLKGGTNNFGIVTRLDLQTFYNTNLWGGLVQYPNSTAHQQFDAFVKWPSRLGEDPYATVIIFCTYSSVNDVTIFTNSYEYTKPIARPPIFDDFLALPDNFTDTMRITNMTDLVYELEQPEHYRIRYYTLTFRNDIRVLEKVNEAFHTSVNKFKAEASGDFLVHYLFQPLPVMYAQRGTEKGGNVLGIDRSSDDMVLCLFYISWTGEQYDELFQGQGSWLVNQVHEYATRIGADKEYIYLDYADDTQDPLSSYGQDNFAKMQAASKKYDPTGVFQHIVPGGFKLHKSRRYAKEEQRKPVKDEL